MELARIPLHNSQAVGIHLKGQTDRKDVKRKHNLARLSTIMFFFYFLRKKALSSHFRYVHRAHPAAGTSTAASCKERQGGFFCLLIDSNCTCDATRKLGSRFGMVLAANDRSHNIQQILSNSVLLPCQIKFMRFNAVASGLRHQFLGNACALTLSMIKVVVQLILILFDSYI